MADRPTGFKADDLALVIKRMNYGEPKEGTPEYEAMAEQVDWENILADDTDLAVIPARPEGVEIPAVALAVSREQAAALLNLSVDSFERHVLPHIRVAQVGRRQLVPVRELEDYLSSKAARALRG
jgi:hypothetical protein